MQVQRQQINNVNELYRVDNLNFSSEKLKKTHLNCGIGRGILITLGVVLALAAAGGMLAGIKFSIHAACKESDPGLLLLLKGIGLFAACAAAGLPLCALGAGGAIAASGMYNNLPTEETVRDFEANYKQKTTAELIQHVKYCLEYPQVFSFAFLRPYFNHLADVMPADGQYPHPSGSYLCTVIARQDLENYIVRSRSHQLNVDQERFRVIARELLNPATYQKVKED